MKKEIRRSFPSHESTVRGTLKEAHFKRAPALFYRSESGNEPVRDWLKAMDAQDRRKIGEDIKTVEFGWPVGMPTCRAMGNGLHEVRTNLSGNRIARVLFYVDAKQRMVLLHGLLKKTQATAPAELATARLRMQRHGEGLR